MPNDVVSMFGWLKYGEWGRGWEWVCVWVFVWVCVWVDGCVLCQCGYVRFKLRYLSTFPIRLRANAAAHWSALGAHHILIPARTNDFPRTSADDHLWTGDAFMAHYFIHWPTRRIWNNLNGIKCRSFKLINRLHDIVQVKVPPFPSIDIETKPELPRAFASFDETPN